MYLNVSGQREVPTLWMSLETIIGQNTPQIWVIGEEHSVHVPDFTFIPVGRFEDVVARIDGRQFVSVGFDANTRIKAQRQNVVNDLRIRRFSIIFLA